LSCGGGSPARWAGVARPGRRLGLAALAAASLAVLAGCTSPRNALGTPTSACYKVLPEARAAVHGQGRFSGVRYVTVADFARALDKMKVQLTDVPLTSSHLTTAVCVVAYRGHFSAADVTDGTPAGARSGRFALVVLRASDARVLATVVLAHAPLRLARIDPLQR
jgi:hypothetical protein